MEYKAVCACNSCTSLKSITGSAMYILYVRFILTILSLIPTLKLHPILQTGLWEFLFLEETFISLYICIFLHISPKCMHFKCMVLCVYFLSEMYPNYCKGTYFEIKMHSIPLTFSESARWIFCYGYMKFLSFSTSMKSKYIGWEV